MDPFEEYLLKKQMGQNSGSQLGDYTSDGSYADQVGSGTQTAAKVAESTPFPYVKAAGLGVDVIGKALGAYGQYEDAEEQKKLQEQQLVRQSKQDAAEEEDRKRRAILESGQYAGNTIEDILKNYGAYSSKIGR